MTTMKFGIGQAITRREDDRLLTGQGRFVDDLGEPGDLHLVFVRSPHAHARIAGIDAAEARAAAGVVAVFTASDLAADKVGSFLPSPALKNAAGQKMSTPLLHPLATDTVRFVGQPVAAVAAESRAAAEAAAALLVVDYEPHPAVASLEAALAAGAPQLWPDAPGNVAAVSRFGDAAACDAAFERAAHVTRIAVMNQRLAPVTIEPRAGRAQVDANGRLTYQASSQNPSGLAQSLAKILGLPPEQVRVVVGDVGGGFGMKTGIYPEDVVVAHAARITGRPVKWAAQRLEDFLSAVHGRDLTTRAELALDADGRILALRLRSFGNVGAYPGGTGLMIALMIGPFVTTGVYDVPVIDFHLSAVMTSTAPVGAYRGAGRPEAVFIMERLMDLAARRLGLDPAELRRRNMIRPHQMPYRNPMGQTYDVGEFEKMLDQGLALADWGGFDARRQASAARGRLRGRGIATFLEWTGGPLVDEPATVRVAGDGFIEVVAATMAMGQGIATSYAQLAVDVFGVPIDRVRIVFGDTDRANGFGSAASRSLFTGGAAVRVASLQTVERAKALAADELEVPLGDLEYAEGRFTVAGTDLGIGLFEVAARQEGAAIVVQASAKADAPSWPNACHVCEVEVDPATGVVEVVAYASVNDIGRVISPAIVRGQVEGGAVQGIGQALSERVVYDRDSGQLLSASFMDYALPHADVFRGFETVFDQSVPCKTNSLGAKGVGELGTIGATPAVFNAVVDALARAGHADTAERLQMPLTPETVWRALQGEAPPALAWPG